MSNGIESALPDYRRDAFDATGSCLPDFLRLRSKITNNISIRSISAGIRTLAQRISVTEDHSSHRQ
jgi:hypothetical protein